MTVIEERASLRGGDEVVITLAAGHDGHPVVQLGLIVHRPGSSQEFRTPVFAIEVEDVSCVEAVCSAFRAKALAAAAIQEADAVRQRPGNRGRR